MKWYHRQMGALLLFLTLPVTWPVTGQLNSLVARVDQPRGPIPAECEQGLSATPPLRVAVRDLELPREEPAEAVAPPSGALRTALQETQLALTRNDRPAFDAALSRAKALLLTYPTGAERRTAEDIVRLHETAARLWDTQYQAPFFSETDPEYALLRELPGYTDAVRRNTLTDDRDRRFYPTAESRDFVAQVAGERLQRLGIRSKPPQRTSTRTAQRESSRPAAREEARVSKPKSPRPAARRESRVSKSPLPATRGEGRVRGASATSTTSADAPPPAPAPTPTPTPQTTETTPVTTTTAEPTPPPVIAETAPITATEVVPAPPPPTRGRSVILPAILILIGLGVLIVLFRASK